MKSTFRRTTRVLLVAAWTAPAAFAGGGVTVRVATFNIQVFNGSDQNQYNAARDILLRVGPDVICLQEMANTSAFNSLAADAGYPYKVLASSAGDIDSGADWAGVMSKFPFVLTATRTAANLSGDPQALDLTRNFILVVVDVPGTAANLALTGNHWKAGTEDADEFRRSIESIRAMQVVAGYDSSVDAFFVVGDMNDDLNDGPDSPSQFNSLPGGLPGNFELGNDITFPVINSVFLPLLNASGPANLNVISVLQKDGSDATRPASGRRLDYLWRSDVVTVLGSEVYDSADEGLPGGLPKYGSPLPAGTSALASDHLLVFADVSLEPQVQPAGACCDDGVCSDGVEQGICTAGGGHYYGDDTTCAGPLDPPCEATGACCQPGGFCTEEFGQTACENVGGVFYGQGTTCAGSLDPPCVPTQVDARMNEVLATRDGGADDMEFVELLGTPFGTLDGFSVLLIEGQTASKGSIDRIIPLDGHGMDADGYFVLGDSDGSLFPDLVVGGSNIFENGSETFLLVRDLPGGVAVGQDVDADNDGLADPAFNLGTIVDAIGLVGGSGYPDYAVYYGAPEVGPQAGLFPAGAARIPNGVDTDTTAEWQYLSRVLDGSDGGVPITPGAANPNLGGNGDFDSSGRVDLRDAAAFQRCYSGPGGGPVSGSCQPGDLQGDDDVDHDDLILLMYFFQGP